MRLFLCFALLAGLNSVAIAADPDALLGNITGNVVGTDGKALPDIPVKLYFAKDPNQKITRADGPRAPGLDAVAETKSDKDGKFKFDGVVPGEYMLIGGDMLKGIGRAPASVKAGKSVEVKITIRKRRAG